MIIKKRFVEVLRGILDGDQDRLDAQFISATRLRAQEGWTWYVLAQSYATNGGVKTWDAFAAQGGGDLIQWDALFGDCPNDVEAAATRLEALSHRFLAPRRAGRTRPALLATFRRFHAVGGPEVIARTWMGHNRTETLLGWLKTFPMIGDKYSRNMCMDVAHPLVLNHVALDHRLNALCDRVEGAPPATPYGPREAWLLGLAAELGVNGWHLDRLLFGRYDEIGAALG